ncbi:MAG: hypothetical protein PHC83_06885 [Bacteroidales bacterium]|nr:hypothetical protein [Bacteroidales bacterium]
MSLCFARFILLLFHPILLGFYFIVYKTISSPIIDYYPNTILYFYAVIIVGYLLLPLVFMYVLHKIGYLKSFTLQTKQDKMIAYVILGISYYLTFIVLASFVDFPLLQLYLLIPLIIIFTLLVISFFFMISANALFMGSLIGFFVGFGYQFQQNYLFVILSLIFSSAWIFSALLILKRNTSIQIYSGFISGMLLFIFLFFYLLH